MAADAIGAEVVPQPGKAVEAAKALQKLGFRVLHVGRTSVSVDGPEALWKAHFPVTFASRAEPPGPGGGRPGSYRRPVQDPVPVPAGLGELVAAVAFAVPPELF
jgi:hypothetical protein